MRYLFLLITILALSFAAAVFAEEPYERGPGVHAIQLPNIATTLKPGQGVEKASGLCAICHSLDYITMQPPFSRQQWTGTVTKMIKVMGAPINDEDAKTVIDYLSTNYGNGK